VTSSDGWVRQAAENCEITPKRSKFLQIQRPGKFDAFGLREKILRKHAKIV
jgi:hypothetical protein